MGLCLLKKNKKVFTRKQFRENLFVLSFLIYPLALFALFYVGVNINSFIMAFQKFDSAGNSIFIGIDNFKNFAVDIINNPLLKISLINSILMWIIPLSISLPLNIFFSYCLFKKCFAHQLFRFIALLPAIVSSFVMCLLFRKFVEGALPDIMKHIFNVQNFPNLLQSKDHAIGTAIFFNIWIGFSGSLIIYPNAMKEIPGEILESAQIDGVSNIFQELRYMILPLIFPTISTFLITGLSGMLISADPLIAFYMYNPPSSSVYNMGYFYILKTVAVSNTIGYPYLAAGGLLLTLVMAPLIFLAKWILDKFDSNTEY